MIMTFVFLLRPFRKLYLRCGVFVLLLAAFFLPEEGYSQWSLRAGGAGSETVTGIGSDGLGNIYLVGTFRDSTNLGGAPITGSGRRPMYLAKLNPDGGHLWSQGVDGDIAGARMVVDTLGHIVLAGNFEGEVDFGDGPFSGENFALFMARYDTAGALVHAFPAGGENQKMANGIGLDPMGRVMLVGAFNGTVDFGGGPLGGSGRTDFFLVKHTPEGDHVWSVTYGGGDSSDHPRAGVVDGDGNMVVAGGFSSAPGDPVQTNLGGSALQGSGGSAAFVARYDTDGNHRWSAAIDASGRGETASALALDASGNVYVAGSFADTLRIGGAAHISRGDRDVFLVKYDSSGAYQWSRSGGGPAWDFIGALTTDEEGHVYLAGSFQETAHFGDDTLTSDDSTDVFVTRYAADGTHRWSLRYGGPGVDVAHRILFDPSGNLYVAGAFEQTIDLGHGPLTSAGENDLFLLKIDADRLNLVAIEEQTVPRQAMALSQPYPNPFSKRARFTLRIARVQRVRLEVYNVLGQRVAVLHDGVLSPHTAHPFNLEAAALPNGLYLLRALGESHMASQPIILLK